MTDRRTPPPTPPHRMLTPTGRRVLAASVIQTAGGVTTALLVADILDATAAAVLRVVGVEDDAARAALASLWSDE